MKPVSGGRPPSDKRIRGVREVIAGAFAHEEASWLILVDLFSLNTRNVESVIRKYAILPERGPDRMDSSCPPFCGGR